MSEWAKELLADVARETIAHISFESAEHQDSTIRTVVAVLERRLLPLLETGDAMRDVCSGLAAKLETAGFERTGSSVQEAWDAAKAKAVQT